MKIPMKHSQQVEIVINVEADLRKPSPEAK